MLEWRDDKTPVSAQFDDPYYSVDDGRAETEYVFIDGNQLKSRWPELSDCTIAELGFGTGLNFLETVRHWRSIKHNGGKLHFTSFEQFPISKDELAKALSNWPDLTDLASQLVEVWDPSPELLDLEFDKDIKLTVYFGDANITLPNLKFAADAWYLDGFSPAKNPELWNGQLMQEVGNRTVAGGTFATYTAAGFVKRNLQFAGFQVQKIRGFGRKREMLTGKMASDIDVAQGY